ncbi:hypothetical protein YC2023_072253 [Brassica napus]
MNWSRSWSKVCDSDRIVPSPSRSASGPWCWVGRSVMFLFDCWLAGWPFISNPWCGSKVFRPQDSPVETLIYRNSFPSSSYPEGNFGGNQPLDGLISLSPLYPSQTNDLHVSIAAGLHQSIVHHLSGPDRHAHTRTLLRRSRSVGCAPVRDPANQLPCALRVYSPVDSHTCQTPFPFFKTSRMGSPQPDTLSTQMPRHAVRRVLQTMIKAATSLRA